MKVKAEGGEAESSDEEASDDDDEGEEGAAQAFHDAVKEKAEIGQVVGDTICTIGEVLCVTPRGRFGELFLTTLHLRPIRIVLMGILVNLRRYRHLSRLHATSWKNLRLPSHLPTNQTLVPSTETRRHSLSAHRQHRSSYSSRTNKVPLLGHAIRKG